MQRLAICVRQADLAPEQQPATKRHNNTDHALPMQMSDARRHGSNTQPLEPHEPHTASTSLYEFKPSRLCDDAFGNSCHKQYRYSGNVLDVVAQACRLYGRTHTEAAEVKRMSCHNGVTRQPNTFRLLWRPSSQPSQCMVATLHPRRRAAPTQKLTLVHSPAMHQPTQKSFHHLERALMPTPLA